MASSPSFFNPSAANNPIMQAYAADPRRALAQSLIASGSNTGPVNSPVEGLARLASALVGGYQNRQLRNEYKERQNQYGETIKSAFNAAEPWRAPDDIMSAPPDTLQQGLGPMPERPAYEASVIVPKGQPVPGTGGLSALASVLAGNPDTAPMAADLRISDFERKQGITDEMAAEERKAKLAQTYRAPTSVAPGAKLVGPDGNVIAEGGPRDPKTVTTAEGVFIQNPDGSLGKRLGAPTQTIINTPRGPAGDYAGTSIEAQDSNVLLNGNPNTPIYWAAFNRQAQPKVTFDPDTGKQIIIRPDMSAYRAPAGAPGPQGAQLPAPGMSAPPPLAGAPPPAPRPQAGGVEINQVAEPKVSFNEGQSVSAGFADRMIDSAAKLKGIDDQGASFIGQQLQDIPGGNYLQTPEYQSYENAKRNFINAQLRKESGASIQSPEYVSAEKQYFPQPGDSPKLIEDKRKLRELATDAMIRAAGPSYKRPGGPNIPPPPPGSILVR